MSMVYQEPGMALNPVLRVGDQIAEVLRAHSRLTVTRAREEAKALLAQVGLAATNGISESYPHQLSGGQKQRVVIAQAIACHPAILIADEPTTALDVATQEDILMLLKSLREKLKMAMLLISHDPAALEQVVDRILVMYAGRLVEDSPTQDVVERPLHPYTRGLLNARLSSAKDENHNQFLSLNSGQPTNPNRKPPGCAFQSRAPEGKGLCRTRRRKESARAESRQLACLNYAR
jgi:oligopeptide/dipeptide ABC transporter ATP-binding protein